MDKKIIPAAVMLAAAVAVPLAGCGHHPVTKAESHVSALASNPADQKNLKLEETALNHCVNLNGVTSLATHSGRKLIGQCVINSGVTPKGFTVAKFETCALQQASAHVVDLATKSGRKALEHVVVQKCVVVK